MADQPIPQETTKDPERVQTSNGTIWSLRAATRGGAGLYAPVEVRECPRLVMATLAELAEHGVKAVAA
ncbi:hypothetical protein [Streptomyces chumphonensis]|uniref:hypothetical protein n=1 Tax=Streptomyces chumphonensis TaxID=1214925 RepID=UPI003D74FF09